MPMEPCEKCEFYWEITRALAGGGRRKTGRGHCLDQSMYASNAPGKPTYPPKAKTAHLPHGCSKVVVVQGKTIQLGCIAFKERKTK